MLRFLKDYFVWTLFWFITCLVLLISTAANGAGKFLTALLFIIGVVGYPLWLLLDWGVRRVPGLYARLSLALDFRFPDDDDQ